MAQDWSQVEDTWEYMEHYLHDFHRYTVVFKELWSTKKTRPEEDANDE